MYTMKTTPSRSGSAASLIALAALGHPGLAQDYGGLTFPSSIRCAETKVDTGNGRKYPCTTIVVKDGWQRGAALFACTNRQCSTSPNDGGLVAYDSLGFYRTSTDTFTPIAATGIGSAAWSGCTAAGCYAVGAACYGIGGNPWCLGLGSGFQYMASNKNGVTNSVNFLNPVTGVWYDLHIAKPGGTISYNVGDVLGVWAGYVSASHADFGFGSYDKLILVTQPHFVTRYSAGPTSGAYLQEGTWKAPGQVDESKPISAAKCAFADGNHYYIEFADYFVHGPRRASGYPKQTGIKWGRAWAYVHDATGDPYWTFQIDPNDLAVGDWFAYPLSLMCLGDERCGGFGSEKKKKEAGGGGGGAAGAIAGGVIGGLVFLCCCAALVVFLVTKFKRDNDAPTARVAMAPQGSMPFKAQMAQPQMMQPQIQIVPPVQQQIQMVQPAQPQIQIIQPQEQGSAPGQLPAASKFCGNCGNPLAAGARFCGSCGQAAV